MRYPRGIPEVSQRYPRGILVALQRNHLFNEILFRGIPEVSQRYPSMYPNFVAAKQHNIYMFNEVLKIDCLRKENWMAGDSGQAVC